nr:hypothetical protein [Francisella tularensis]
MITKILNNSNIKEITNIKAIISEMLRYSDRKTKGAAESVVPMYKTNWVRPVNAGKNLFGNQIAIFYRT